MSKCSEGHRQLWLGDHYEDCRRCIDSFRGDYFFLSNFYVGEPVVFRGCPYKSAEHLYQSRKATTIADRDLICNAATPGLSKRYARIIRVRPNWDDLRVEAMRDTLHAKFRVDSDLWCKLKATGKRELIEGNTWGDRFWGKCGGSGENMLGKLLMELRDA